MMMMTMRTMMVLTTHWKSKTSEMDADDVLVVVLHGVVAVVLVRRKRTMMLATLVVALP
jgi:hypothetical protein